MTFLSISVVEVILKLSKQFQLEGYDEFSILDTLEFALDNKFEMSDKEENIDDICIFILSVSKITEKFNKAMLNISKEEIKSLFDQLEIKNVNCIKDEFEAYKLMDFEIKEPQTFCEIYNMIENHFDKSSEEKMIVFNCAIDVLRLVYCWKAQIFDNVENENAIKNQNHYLLAASTICVALKILNFSDIVNIFESICSNFANELSLQKVNQLSSKIYSLIQTCKN
ncbi:hypothetical protein PVAND_003576 [Polypedilum vanderplanki]|uniref:Uncharacterized protein n=1 Tax=Polypedilum vanderplanki TaxID=319348 RepID=A0A9J6BUZ5_POLVA|nr:hypothetical protein PVAND_003576 [Polypedilum vanderplanki]